MSLNKLAAECHQIAVDKGWYQDETPLSVQLINIHGEVSEAWEEWRAGREPSEVYFRHDNNDEVCRCGPDYHHPEHYQKRKPDGIPIELADILIRTLDTCAEFGIDIDAAVRLKMEFNKTRSFRHGGKRA